MSRMSRLFQRKEARQLRFWRAVAAALVGVAAGMMVLRFVPGMNGALAALGWLEKGGTHLGRSSDGTGTDRPGTNGAGAVSTDDPGTNGSGTAGADHPRTGGTYVGKPAATEPDPPPPPDPRWAPLQERFEAYLGAYAGRWAAVVVDLTSGARWEYNAADRFHPASTIKMPVNLFALHEYRAGRFNWETLITYTPDDYESPGGGAFETAPFGGQYPASNLVYRSLVYSNNVAVNMLGRTLGWQNIRDFTGTIGGDLYRNADGSPAITAASAAGWWLYLLEVERQAPAEAQLILGPLSEVAYDGRIAAGLPPGTPHLHKFGSYDGNYHDTGVVLGESPYVLVILTHGMDEYEADEAIAGASRITWDFFARE